MTYQTRAYDRPNADSWPDPVAVVVAEGTHDVSRLLHLFSRGLIEHVQGAEQLLRQTRRRNGGRAALALLHQHGGPDLTALTPDTVTEHLVAYWGPEDRRSVKAAPGGNVVVYQPNFSLRMDPAAARRLADQLWAAADYAERAKASEVVAETLGSWKACPDPEHTAPVDDSLEECPEHGSRLMTVNAAGYEVVR